MQPRLLCHVLLRNWRPWMRFITSTSSRSASLGSTATASKVSAEFSRTQMLEALRSATLSPQEDLLRTKISIDDLIEMESEKAELNEAFWGPFTDIPSMALAQEKEDIIRIMENFALIHRKHIHLFQHLKATVLRTMENWTAPELASLCQSFAQLGYLHEDILVRMSPRIKDTAHTCTPQELSWLLDAYATARCSAESALNELTSQSMLRLEEFTLSQLFHTASSYARLNVRNEPLFLHIAARLEQGPLYEQDVEDEDVQRLSARDLTLAAYSFAKLGHYMPRVFEILAQNAIPVARDFTSKDLQTFMVAFAQVQHRDPELLDAISAQAQRRIAQFNATSLALMLRAMSALGRRDDIFFTRVVAQLPRAILPFRPADVTTLLASFAASQVHSQALFDIVTPFILEKAPLFRPDDWLLALHSFAELGHRDEMFLTALGHHLEESQLSASQQRQAIADCARLDWSTSFQ